MSSLKRHLPTALLIALLLAVNVGVLVWTNFFRGTPPRPFVQYEGQIPRLAGRSLSGDREVEVDPHATNLVVYFSRAQLRGRTVETAKYAELLSQRFRDRGLRVTGVVRGVISDMEVLVEHSLISYDVLSDSDGRIGNQLGLTEDESGVFLFDREGKCLFATRRPTSAEDLRQLAAVEIMHADPLGGTSAPQQLLEKGQAFRSWGLVNAESLERTELDRLRADGSDLFVFFTAACSVCSLPGHLEKFAAFEKRRTAAGQERPAVLVFDFNFARSDVLEQLKTFKISSPAYIAVEELTAVSDSGYTRALGDDSQVVAVTTDKSGAVADISSLSAISDGKPVSTAPAPLADAGAAAPAVFEEMFDRIPLSAYDVATHGGRYYVSDMRGNRVLVFDGDMRLERSIGTIGSGPGRLIHPGYLDVSGGGTLYVQDGGNERIERFTPDGRYAGEFPTPFLYEGFAVGRHEEVYLGQPENGHLVTVYSETGKVTGGFGELKKFSDVYGAEFAEKDTLYERGINRVRLSTDKEGNVYVSFMLAPLLQKYSPDGRLLFERRLEGPEVDRVTNVLLQHPPEKFLSFAKDGFEERIVALDPISDPKTGNIYVLLADGSIYVADREGRKVSVLSRQGDQRPAYPFMGGLGARGEILIIPFSPRRCYRLSSPV
jgi:DNA-binding beta-propeller fold protein YncE